MGIIRIAVLCILFGTVSIPISFTINSSPVIVWLGNALGSLVSALVVIYIGERITSQAFKDRLSRRRVGKKVVKAFDETNDNKKIEKTSRFIDNHGLRLFSLVCPIFPGTLISTAAVYVLGLNRRIYKRWLSAGIFLVSGVYVFGYWWIFVKS